MDNLQSLVDEFGAILVYDMPNEVYHMTKPFISASRLKKIKKSTAHFLTPDKSERKKHFDIGHAFELYLVEPSTFHESVAIFREDERPELEKTFASTKNKQWKENFYTVNESKYIISYEDFQMILEMTKNCKNDPFIKEMLDKAKLQPSIFYKTENSVYFKTRPDIVSFTKCGERMNIIDIKTALDGSPQGFAKASANLDYPVQCGTQIMGVEKFFGKQVENYFYLVAEKESPYNATMYYVDDTDKGQFVDLCHNLLDKAKTAIETKQKRGYSENADNPQGVLKLNIPVWYWH